MLNGMKILSFYTALAVVWLVPCSNINANIYQCMDAAGQRIFSDKPCSETLMGEGAVDNFDERVVELQKIPMVIDEQAANQIRYRMTSAQAREKYCAKYSQIERNRLISLRQVVQGMYLADVIKVWGAPIASDGNTVIFQDEEEEVTIALIEGCVINIQRNLDLDSESYQDNEPIENY